MDLEKELFDLGLSRKEAREAAELFDSLNQNELLYAAILMAGIKVGRQLERKDHENA